MNPECFRNSPSGRLVKVGSGDSSYRAFVPNPLPPELPIEKNLVRRLSEADRSLGELAGLGRAIPNPHLLIGPFMRREAVLSSRIEGTQADIKDLYVYEAKQLQLPGLRPSPSESDVREVLNYVRAMEYGLKRLDTLPVSLRMIRELHERLMEGVRGEQATPGEFRRSQNWIGRAGCTLNDADFVPPPVNEMQEALDAFEKYLHSKDDYPPLVQLALIHYQFEAIHPFLDGNGRIGRLLLTLLLINWNLMSLPLLYLSAFFEKNRDEYYDLLMKVSANGAWQEWITFFFRGVEEQARDATVRAKRLQDLQMAWRERLSQVRASTSVLRHTDSLFVSPVITIPEAQRTLGAKQYHTARKIIEKLVKAGILKQVSESSYGKTFLAEEILQAIGEGGK